MNTSTHSLSSDQAISILRGTQDGDLLDSSDLSLVQEVVNRGIDSLSDIGKEYWAKLVASCASGDYVKRWFCGVENLTRDARGYVYWKGRQVEHYSYDSSRRNDMIDSARRLAAVCLKIEVDGGQVSPHSINEMHKDMDFAQGIKTPRFLVAWLVQKEGAKISVLPIQDDSRHIAKPLIDRECKERAAQWGGTSEPRSFLVVTQDDLRVATECIHRDHEWAKSHFWPAYRSTEILGELLQSVRQKVSSDNLITTAEVHRIVLDGLLDKVTQASEQLLMSDSLQAARLVPPAERGERA